MSAVRARKVDASEKLSDRSRDDDAAAGTPREVVPNRENAWLTIA